MPSNITMKRRKSWLLAASALASSSLGISGPALAQVLQCRLRQLLMPSGNATCTAGTFPTRIIYNQPTPNHAIERHA